MGPRPRIRWKQQPSEYLTQSLAGLIVSIAALGWAIYHDLKQDATTASLDRTRKAERLSAKLQDHGTETANLPAHLTHQQHLRIINVIATEIVAVEPGADTPALGEPVDIGIASSLRFSP
jgi:hypothetical protein